MQTSEEVEAKESDEAVQAALDAYRLGAQSDLHNQPPSPPNYLSIYYASYSLE